MSLEHTAHDLAASHKGFDGRVNAGVDSLTPQSPREVNSTSKFSPRGGNQSLTFLKIAHTHPN